MRACSPESSPAGAVGSLGLGPGCTRERGVEIGPVPRETLRDTLPVFLGSEDDGDTHDAL